MPRKDIKSSQCEAKFYGGATCDTYWYYDRRNLLSNTQIDFPKRIGNKL